MCRLIRVAFAVSIAVSLSLARTSPAVAATSLRVVPNPTTQSVTVTAFGSGFCGATTCPVVRLVIGSQTVALASVEPDGSFRASFVAPSIPNQYAVVAMQDGPVPGEASVGLLVLPTTTPPSPPGDRQERTSQTTSPAGTTTPSGQRSLSPPDSTDSVVPGRAKTSASDQGRSSDAWLWLLLGVVVVGSMLGIWYVRRRQADRPPG